MLFRDAVLEHEVERVVLDEAVFRRVASYFQRAWRQPLGDVRQLQVS